MKNFIIKQFVGLQNALNAKKQKGFGTIEIVLIMFVLVSLVIIFKDKVESLIKDYLGKIDPKFKLR